MSSVACVIYKVVSVDPNLIFVSGSFVSQIKCSEPKQCSSARLKTTDFPEYSCRGIWRINSLSFRLAFSFFRIFPRREDDIIKLRFERRTTDHPKVDLIRIKPHTNRCISDKNRYMKLKTVWNSVICVKIQRNKQGCLSFRDRVSVVLRYFTVSS